MDFGMATTYPLWAGKAVAAGVAAPAVGPFIAVVGGGLVVLAGTAAAGDWVHRKWKNR